MSARTNGEMVDGRHALRLKLYIEFDSAFTGQDVGTAFFQKFGGEKAVEIDDRFRDGGLTRVEYFHAMVEAIGSFDAEEAEVFFRLQRIDETFKEFVGFCRRHGLEFHILNDGLDFSIGPMLESLGIRDVSYFANSTRVVGGRFVVGFPHTNAECTRCACCRRNIMLTRSAEEDVIVFIGKGYSDRCPAQYADIVFAKDELQTFCQRENISHYLYRSFHDVVCRLDQLLHGKRLKKRLRAEHMRQAAFQSE